MRPALCLVSMSLIALCACQSDQPTPHIARAQPTTPAPETSASTPRSVLPAGKAKKKTKKKKRPSPNVTSLSWNEKGELLVGWADGHFSLVDVKQKRGKIKKASSKGEVQAISPDAKIALVRGEPNKIVRTKDRVVLIELNRLEGVHGAAFSTDGRTLMISSANHIHVWKDVPKLPKLITKTGVRLDEYLSVEAGNWQAGLGEMSGPIAMDTGPHVAYGAPNGQLTWWDVQNPTEAYAIARVEPPMTSIALKGDLLLATSGAGSLLAASVKERQKLDWAKGLTAQQVAASPVIDGGFAMVSDDTLSYRSTETGEVIWDATLGEGELCGLALGAKATKKGMQRKRVAVCKGNKISLYMIDGGKHRSTFERDRKRLIWTNPKKKKGGKKKSKKK